MLYVNTENLYFARVKYIYFTFIDRSKTNDNTFLLIHNILCFSENSRKNRGKNDNNNHYKYRYITKYIIENNNHYHLAIIDKILYILTIFLFLYVAKE